MLSLSYHCVAFVLIVKDMTGAVLGDVNEKECQGSSGRINFRLEIVNEKGDKEMRIMKYSARLLFIPLTVIMVAAESHADPTTSQRIKSTITSISETCPSGGEPCWLDITLTGGMPLLCQSPNIDPDICRALSVGDCVQGEGNATSHLGDSVVAVTTVYPCP